METKPTIFVQIASYRDPECQWTVKDLFEKAEHPDRVTVGICSQADPVEDKDCFIIPSPRPAQTRIVSVPPSESLGVCWARAKTQELFENEDYVLMIDSHMRFVPGWDTALIKELSRCPSPKSFLSTYPPGYKPPDQLEPSPRPIVMRAQHFSPQGDIRFEGETLAEWPSTPLRGAFLAGGFVFAPGKFVREVPYDPHIYFDHEEVTIAARAYTHGWDVFSPPGVFVYHYYHEPQKGETRALHWSDNRDWTLLQQISRARYNYLLADIAPENPQVLADIKRYSLGWARSMEDFEAFTGIDFKNKEVSERGLTAQFIEGIDLYRLPVAKRLKAGDTMPSFRVCDETGQWHDAQSFAGKPVFLCVLPSNFDAYTNEFKALYNRHQKEFQAAGFGLVFISPARENSEFYQALHIAETVHDTHLSFLVNAKGKISALYDNRNAENHINDLLRASRDKAQ
jgi:hypothetical protein